MTKGRSLKDLVDGGLVPPPSNQLSQDEKEALADAGTPFAVTAVREGEGAEFGGYWEIDAIISGKEQMFMLSMHDKREQFMLGLINVLSDGPVEGCRLANKGGKKGSPFLTIEPVE